MENDVVKLEGQVKELLHTTDLLADIAIHFPFVRLLLATMEHKHVV